MKKIMLMLVLAALATAGRAELVDDFESYDVGAVRDVASPPWTAIGNTGLALIIDDGTGNKVLGVGWNSDWRGTYNDNIAPVADGTSDVVLFFNMYANSEELNHVFGLSDVASENLGWFSDYEVQLGLVDNGTLGDGLLNFNVRNAGGNITTEIELQTWYNVWAIIDQVNDTYDVYISTGEADINSATLVADDAMFRNAEAGPVGDLTALLACGYYANGQQDMWIDNVDLGDLIPRPYEPVVEQTANGAAVDALLQWKPARDPEGIEAVNPAITEEYIFLGVEGGPQYYVGTLGDPGVAEVISELQVAGLSYDTTYNWTVVDAIPEHEDTFVSTDTLEDADPNNLVGPTWSFATLLSSAEILSNPVDVRAFAGDDSVSFTVGFTTAVNPVVSATWYKNGVEVVAGGNVSSTFTSAAGDGEAVLTIATPTLADEGAYYCVLSTDPGQTSDDVTTATRLLVINQLLAEYTFDNAADPLANTGEQVTDAATVKTILLADPNTINANSVTDVEATTADGIVGNALVLSSDDTIGEYVDLGVNSFPRAGELNTVGDVRGEGYWKQGFGRGMDAGSILMWVKLESDGSLISNASNSDGTHFGVTTDGATSARVIVRGDNWGEDASWQNLGEANGSYSYMTDYSLQDGEWHMIAATWNDSTARIYINGELVAENTQGYAEDYTAWEYSNTIGASRQGQPNRYLLNASDFITGAIDELRIYNYPVSAEAIADEYELLNEVGVTPCMNHNFVGSEVNLDNSVDSYCIVDLSDFALLAGSWLANGF